MELKQKYVLTLDVAKQIVAAAEAEAISRGWTVAISILDDGGHLILFHRIDGTQFGSCEISILKARTAISLKRPTKKIAEAVANGKTGFLSISGVITLEGGLPLEYQGEIVGAIGVSGMASDQDGIIAQIGADVLASIGKECQ